MGMRRLVVLTMMLLAVAAPPTAGGACRAQSGERLVPLVELYTSEGCSSCPPADRWLSAQLPPGAAATAVALAFHVDYWDRLGWKDRFATPAYTARQYQTMRANRATFVYTPQVVVQGRDFPGWRRGSLGSTLGSTAAQPAKASIRLDARATADAVHAAVAVSLARDPRASTTLALAYAESGLTSDVKAGENRGERLWHDHVARVCDARCHRARRDVRCAPAAACGGWHAPDAGGVRAGCGERRGSADTFLVPFRMRSNMNSATVATTSPLALRGRSLRRGALLVATHVVAMAIGFGAGVYTLPILIEPPGPPAAEVKRTAADAPYRAEFRRRLKGSDALHWGEGTVSVGRKAIVLDGRLAPGPDYKLYLVRQFVETEEEFLRVKSKSPRIGEIRTFNGFIVPVPENVDIDQYDTVLVWCERFKQFITAAKYR